MKSDFTLKLFKEIATWWIEDLSSTKSRQIKFVEVLSRICQRQKGLNGSRSYRSDKNFLDGQGICRKAIETKSKKLRWIKDAKRSVKKRSPRVSIDSYLSRIYREAVELDKTQRKEKHTEMNAIKQATKSKIQTNVKLSKTSLKKIHGIHRSKTRTHTKQV